MRALCLLLGPKWQPPSGKACPLNRIHENGLPRATEILGCYKDCRWINRSCFHQGNPTRVPITVFLHKFVHLESRNSCSCSGPYQGCKQSPEVSHNFQDWQLCPPLPRAGALHTEETGEDTADQPHLASIWRVCLDSRKFKKKLLKKIQTLCYCVFVGDHKDSPRQTLFDTMKSRSTWWEKAVAYLSWMAEFAGKSCVLSFEALLCEFSGLFLFTEENPKSVKSVGNGVSQRGEGTL